MGASLSTRKDREVEVLGPVYTLIPSGDKEQGDAWSEPEGVQGQGSSRLASSLTWQQEKARLGHRKPCSGTTPLPGMATLPAPSGKEGEKRS